VRLRASARVFGGWGRARRPSGGRGRACFSRGRDPLDSLGAHAREGLRGDGGARGGRVARAGGAPGAPHNRAPTVRLKADSATGNAPRMRARNWDAAAHLQLAEVPGGHGVSRPGLDFARSRSRRRVPLSETKQSSRKRRKPAALSTCRLSGTPTTALPLQKGVSARVAAQRLPWTDTGAASPSARAQSQQSPRMKGKYCAPLSLSSPGVIDPGPVTEMPVIFAFRPHPCNPTASPARAALRKHQPFPSMDKLEQK